MAKPSVKARYDVIIIGAGIGGLTCGAMLAQAGKKVLICEQHSLPGGYVTSFSRHGFTFDGGLQSLASNGLIFPILRELGLWEELRFVRAHYQLITPDMNLKLNSLAQVKAGFKQAFPQAQNEVEAYFGELDRLLVPFAEMFGGDKVAPSLLPGSERAQAVTFGDKTNISFLRELVRYQKMSSLDFINKYITDRNLKYILASIGYPVMSVVNTVGMWYSFLKDYWYPIGGMQNLTDLITDLFKGNGGELILQSRVERILTENGTVTGVRLAEGRDVLSEFVVSNADWRQTFIRLIDPGYLDEEFITGIEGGKVSETMFCVYLGTDLDPGSLARLAHHVYYFPGYGKTFLEKAINDPGFFENCMVSIAIPSLSDASLAPDGKSVVTITSFAPYDYRGRWQTGDGRNSEACHKLKEKVAEQLVEITEGIIPGLSQHIIVREIATPLTYERYTLNSEGASVGWSWDPAYAVVSRYRTSVGSIETPVKNLFTCGHWCYPPGGVPIAMLTGRNVTHLIRNITNKR
jgi:phytoene dehydrogenase-like protein